MIIGSDAKVRPTPHFRFCFSSCWYCVLVCLRPGNSINNRP